MNQFDVLVVGGGPAGSVTAAFCALHGLSVGLLEHHRFPRHKVCGDVINPNCWPILDRLGARDALQSKPLQQSLGVRFVSPAGTELSVRKDLVCMQRAIFDDCLLQHAVGCGVTVFQGEGVRDIQADGTVITGNDRYRARYLVGADGRHSVVAQKAGLVSTDHQSDKRDAIVAFQSHFAAPSHIEPYVYLHLFRGGYSGAVQVDETRVNLCIVTRWGSGDKPGMVPALFEKTVWRNTGFRKLGIEPTPLEPLQALHPLWRRPNLARRGNTLLVGDALRVMEPFSGQGIYFALRTAELAASAIRRGVERYDDAVRALYNRRARTNELVRGLMYRAQTAAAAIQVLRRWPAGLNWLAGNVLDGYNEAS